MLLIKTKLALSKIQGIGLFADEFITKGTKIWEYSPGMDQVFTKEEINALPELEKHFFFTYAYLYNGKYYLDVDHCRFFNHSDSCNCDEETCENPKNNTTPKHLIALKDIQPGEELTCNYFRYDYDETCVVTQNILNKEKKPKI